ncbi:hypothetical protein ABZ671_18450 [Micromonospora sp. NPDC006766]|uniref:hypothetical protein n=1 Tax=Micromonospora sp. NPDC006766 TaxID=3154778 RepID=UPI00340682B8
MNLTDAKRHLEDLQTDAGRDVEDARASRQLADEDLGRFDRLHGNMIRLFGPAGAGVTAVGRLRDRALQRATAAIDRSRSAAAANAAAATFAALLDQHLSIRERGQAAGGLAQREAYGAGTNRPTN